MQARHLPAWLHTTPWLRRTIRQRCHLLRHFCTHRL